MTKLRWDKLGERFYETGIDRGVLYLSDGSGVAWSGLTSVEEDAGDESASPLYFDGVKYFDAQSASDYSATLTALTYPDEFLDFEGITDLGNGLLVDGQEEKLFGLSYRTRIGNDVEGTEYGYKIHLVYNLTAAPDETSYQTRGQSNEPINFSWKISGIPEHVVGYKPTAHIIFDSTELESSMFAGIEDILYGDVDTEARQPSLSELVDIVSLWNPKLIVPDSVGGLALLVNGSGDLTQIKTVGVYSALPSTRLVQSDVEGFYQLVP